jgi:SAM-dependent methyltransferase
MDVTLARAPAANVRAAYDLWACNYPAVAHNPLMRLEQEIVESILATVRPRRVLDVGTGSGRYLTVLAGTGATSVIGVDFSMAMLRRAGAGKRVCADALRLPFGRKAFDVINASLMVGDVADLDAWTREMALTLTRGGHLLYSDFHPSWTEHGWKRTFRSADGAPHDLAFVPHTIDQHLAAIEAAGLRVVAIREPRFKDDADRDVKAFRRRWKNPPVVVVFHARKEP